MLLFYGSRHATFAFNSYQARYSFTRLFSEKSRIIFLGTPDVAASSLRRIVEKSKEEESNFEVVGVVTQPPKRRRRKKGLEPSPVGKIAEELDIHTLSPVSAKDKDFLDELEDLRPDLCITAAYGQYLPKKFLATPKYGTLNIHPSLLPRWRGASPVQRSLEAGDDPIGVTVLFTVSKMDAGPIVKQTTKMVDENAQATEVLPWLFEVGTEDLLEALPDVLTGKVTMENAQAQDEKGIVAANMISKDEGVLKIWEESATTCHNRVRGFSMWPGTTIALKIEGSKDIANVKVNKTRVMKTTSSKSITNDISLSPSKDSLMVSCADGSILELLEVTPPRKKKMDARSFWNGCQGKKIEWINPSEEIRSTLSTTLPYFLSLVK